MSVLSDQVARQWRQTRFNPLSCIEPQRLVRALDAFDIGYVRDFALIYSKMEETDANLATLCTKRRSAASRLKWEIVINDGSEEDRDAQLHRELLLSLYTNITHRDCLDLDYIGGLGGLIERMMNAWFIRKDVHELSWSADGADLALECTHAHLALFEETTGRLRYTGPLGGIGTQTLDQGEWLVAKGYGIGIALAIASMYKNLSLKDWLAWNELVTQRGLHGTTTAKSDSKEWREFATLLEGYAADWTGISGDGTKINPLSFNGTSGDTFRPLFEIMKAAQASLVMGGDLSTTSGHNKQGASLQADDKTMLLEDDARRISETLNLWIDRAAIALRFGRGVLPLASFRLLSPLQQDDKLEMDKDKHLKDMGVIQSPQAIADKWGVQIEDISTAPPAAKSPASSIKDRASSSSEPASNADTSTPDSTGSDEDMTAALREDLQPLAEALASYLQAISADDAAQPSLADLESIITEQVMSAVLDGTALEDALRGEKLLSFLEGSGLPRSEALALINDAINSGAEDSNANTNDTDNTNTNTPAS